MDKLIFAGALAALAVAALAAGPAPRQPAGKPAAQPAAKPGIQPTETPMPEDMRKQREAFEAHATKAVQTLDDFHDAASKADFERYFSHWTETSVFLGTDATERWVGDEFKAFARPIFEKGKGWTYRPHDRRLNFSPDAQHAFFDELLDNDKLGLCRGSGVLRFSNGSWKILQYNLSIPVPNELAAKVTALIKEEGAKKPPAAEPSK
jgi:SnoaL-like protein